MIRWLLLGVVLFAVSAEAQIVNVQSRFADALPEGLHGAAEASTDWRTGSNDYLTLKGAVTAHYKNDPSLVLMLVSGEYGVASELRTLAKTLEHLRYRHHWSEHWSSEFFLQHEYDGFRRLTSRGLAGVGGRYQFVSEKRGSLALGVAGMFDFEKLTVGEFSDSGRTYDQARFSSYAIGRLLLAEGVNLVQTLYYQPKMDDFADWRLLEEASLVVQPTKRFGISVGVVIAYDSRSPESVARLDTQVKSTLGISF